MVDNSERSFRFAPWFVENWSRAAAPTAVLLLALTPFLFVRGLSLPLLLVYLQLPMYMIHQYEEHSHGAFRAYVNHYVAGDYDALTNTAIFWINILGVWGVDLVAFYLAVFVAPTLGLIAVYLTLVNALSHGVGAIIARRYNPGLWTSLILFIPIGAYAVNVFVHTQGVSLIGHAIALGIAIALHVVIFVTIRARLVRLRGK